MARILTVGFESGSVVAGIEASTVSGTPVVDGSRVRSGNYSFRCNALTSGASKRMNFQFLPGNDKGPYYYRFYLNVATAPNVTNRIAKLTNLAGSECASIQLTTSRTLQFRDEDGQVGSASPALALDTGYLVEFMIDQTPAGGSQIVEARVGIDDGTDSTTFASSTTRNITNQQCTLLLGGNLSNETCTTGDWYFDDVGINDATLSKQNTWLGPGHVIHLHPAGAGDSNTFATQVGGTAGSGNNWTRVSEELTDNATSYNGDNTVNREDMFTIGASGLVNAQVNLVAVGFMFRNSAADAVTTIVLQLKKAPGGTVVQSAATVPNFLGWKHNQPAAANPPLTHPIIRPRDPDNVDWTVATVDTIQAGYKITVGGTNRVDVSWVYVLVEYIDVSPPPPRPFVGASQAAHRAASW